MANASPIPPQMFCQGVSYPMKPWDFCQVKLGLFVVLVQSCTFMRLVSLTSLMSEGKICERDGVGYSAWV